MHRNPPNESTTREPALAWLRASRDTHTHAPASDLVADVAEPGFFAGPQAAWALETWLLGGESLAELEDRSSSGESIAARSLAAVHAVVVALSGKEPVAPRASLRDRLLASASGSSASATDGDAAARPSQLPTLIPPVVAVGQKHAKRPDDVGRAAAVARLGADRRDGDPELERLLVRVAAWLDFPLLVVSVVHGGETVHRAHYTTLPNPPRVVPREASYCTHCVAGDGPLVIENARADAFFSQHPAVAAFNLVAYCGVPLRVGIGTAGEAVVGTLCGYDLQARPILVEDAATLEIFARRVASIIESGEGDDPTWSDAGSGGEAREVLAPGPFLDLALVALRRASHAAGDRSALVVGPAVVSIPHDDTLVEPGFALAAGRLADGRSGWLVRTRSGAGSTESLDAVAERLAAKLAARLEASVGVATAGGSGSDVASDTDVDAWIRRATAG